MVIYDVNRLADDIKTVRALAGRQVGVFASSHLICRPTRREAEEYHHYIVQEKGDWEGAEYMMSIRISGGSQSTPPDKVRQLKERYISGSGTFPVIGSYDDAAETYNRLSDAGLDGLGVALVNYIDEFPHLRDGVLPRLERLGLRGQVKTDA